MLLTRMVHALTEFWSLKTVTIHVPRWLHQWLLTPDVTKQLRPAKASATGRGSIWLCEMPAPSPEEQIQVNCYMQLTAKLPASTP